MTTIEVLEHVMRPRPPWRDSDWTECGLNPATLDPTTRPVITRDALIRKVKDLGVKRTAMSTCVTCYDTARRWKTWEEDPVQVIGRETYGAYGGRDGLRRELFRDELLAIEELIKRYPDEFTAIKTGLSEATSLADHRRTRRLLGGQHHDR